MEIDKERLKVIGKLIGIYRETLRDNSLNEYTLSKFSEGICSINTLKNIEAGNIGRSEDVYIDLLAKLNLKFYYVPSSVDNAITEIMSELYEAIEYFNNEKIDEITNKILRILDKVKDNVYYSELYTIINDVRSYYLNLVIISDEKYKFYDTTYHLFDSIFSKMLILLMFSRLQKTYMNDVDVCKQFVEKYDILNNKMMAIKTIMAYYYAISGQYISMKELVEITESNLKLQNNYARLITVYNYAIMMASYINPIETMEYVRKLEKIILEQNLSKQRSYEVYYFIGNALHHLKDFESALSYYERALENDDYHHIIDIIFMADCQSRLNIQINIPLIPNIYLQNQPNDVQFMYNYFVSYDLPDFAKENYIMKKIAPNLKNDDFIDIFRFELEKIVERTGHYKTLYNFNLLLRANNAIMA